MARPALKAGEHGEITVVSREEGYEARCRVRGLDGRVRQVSRRGRTKGIAKARLIDVLEAVSEGAGDLTLAAYLDQWLDGRKAAGRAVRTIESYSAAVVRVKSGLGGIHPADLRASQVQRFLDALPPAVAKNSLNALRGAVMCAVMDDALVSSPLVGVKVNGGQRRGEPRALSVDGFKRFRAHMGAYRSPTNSVDPDFMRLVDWLAATGCRTGEALGVHGQHIQRGVWAVGGTVIEPMKGPVFFQAHTKAHDGRKIVLVPPVRENIPASGLVFPSSKGTLRRPANFRHQWRRRLVDSEWQWVTPKTLRKTVATVLDRELGSNAAALALGHASDEMTKRHYIEPERLAADFGGVLRSLFEVG